ncbi:uncharacterized protein LOC124145357 [Haliotis rufescens]|uniref:uncharacterized protein LOC124145357 n=1 Tax=Haliotis rufescens TaxID=6454 RepID=UPI00201ECD77|nr:uncharacterized protein LOC124145357 [Haliotis rufescens]
MMNIFTIFWRASPKASRCFSLFAKSKLDRRSVDNMTYYVSFADKPVCFIQTENTDKGSASEYKELRKQVSSCLPGTITENTLFVAEQTGLECSDALTGYIQSCITLYRLKRSIDSGAHHLAFGTRLDSTVACGSRNSQDLDGEHLKRCLFVCSKKNTTSTVPPLLNMTIPGDVCVSTFVQRDETNVFERKILESDSSEVKRSLFRLYCPKHASTNKYKIPPMFNTPSCSPVFHSFERTMDILARVSDMPEVRELLSIGKKELPGSVNIESLQSQLKHPFVVVEGMDAAGKTTLTETLEHKMQAARYHTPPPCIQHLRKFFDPMPEIVRRAYYSLGNYIVAVQIAEECQQKAVIMDRFWHSTAAYGIANETSLSDQPPPGHITYNWPCDLLRPTVVLFLNVTEDVRKQRMNFREAAMTYEEQRLDTDALFRQRLCEAYKRMGNPACTEIDASGTRETVVDLTLSALHQHRVVLT